MKRNKFSLSHYRLATCDLGYLIPLTWYEVLPGDTVQQATSALIRVQPLLAPVMHPVRVRIHHWYVPLRLIWDNFEDFITGGPDGDDETEWPYIQLNGVKAQGTLREHMGLPPGTYSTFKVSALPFRAYNLIYNENYRDQDLCAESEWVATDGIDATTNHTNCHKVAWEKDFFTAARLTEQKGTEVTIPIGDAAPVSGIGYKNTNSISGPVSAYETDGDGASTYAKYKSSNSASADHEFYVEEDPDNAGYPNVRADLTASTGVNINDLRLALALQRYQEARNRYGSRYVEYLRSLGVRSSDARLSMPEYLGGGRQVIQFSEVLQTAPGTDPVGTLKGHGIGAMRSNRWRRFFEEHGIVMTLMSVVPKTIYSQALHRKWIRETKEDYFQKELQFLGDQAVFNKEAYAFHSAPDTVFGYQGRYDDYRSHPSSIGGEFHDTLDHWHMARIHSGDIALNSSFIECVPTTRIYASESTDPLYVMANHSIQARRLLTRNPIPRTF